MNVEWYLQNRELIKNLAFNTGTTGTPVYTPICTTSEVSLNTEMDNTEWYVFCDSLKRRLITGASVVLSGTLKLDINNAGDIEILNKVHTLIASGEISQFNRTMIQFDLLTGVNNGTLEYTTYQADATLSVSDLGGAAEEVSEFSFELVLIGTATEVTP